MKVRSILAVAGLMASIVAAHSQELVIGSKGDPSLDPHYIFLDSNVAFWKHLYGSLTAFDNEGKVEPNLAASYRSVDDRTWEFKLRTDVKFEDSSLLTADDVVYSLERVRSIPGNPSPYTALLETITSVEAVDPATVRITTSVANPWVPGNLAHVAILPRKATEGRATGDFAAENGIGEYGPYRVSSFTPGDRLVLDRNEEYWGEKPYWARVTFRILPTDASRVAALLAGDVDLIDFVPPTDVERLRTNDNVSVHEGPSGRLMQLVFNYRDGAVGGVTGSGGEPLEHNALREIRVRQAVLKSIDRQALVDRIMGGQADVASQVAMPSVGGYDSDLQLETPDPAQAKALLAEAGFPDGLGVTISCSNNRYPNDARICQALGQMLARGGFRPTVDTQPMSVFMASLRRPAEEKNFAIALVGLGGHAQRPSSLVFSVHSVDVEGGRGAFNFGGYSNPELDRLIVDANTTLDQTKRNELLAAAVRRTNEEVAVIPLFFQKVVTASRADISYTTNSAELTLAWNAKPKTQ